MGRSVFIDFPIPTLEEYGKSLGMSKKRQQALIEIVRQHRRSGRTSGSRPSEFVARTGEDASKRRATLRAK